MSVYADMNINWFQDRHICGIFGIYNANTSNISDAGKLNASTSLPGHRGPDANGTYSAEGIGLAHTRLSLPASGCMATCLCSQATQGSQLEQTQGLHFSLA